MGVISVVNYKGGVGKTTLSANIAAGIASRGKEVLMIDLDPQANLTLSFVGIGEYQNFDLQGRTIKHWYDAFLDHNVDSSLKELIVTPSRINDRLGSLDASGRVDMICSHLELINVDMELSSVLGGNTDRSIRSNYLRVLTRLRCKLDELKEEYDVVIIDCPPNFNLVTQNAIVASDAYIVPAKADYLSTLGIDNLKRHVNELKKRFNKYSSEVDQDEPQLISPRMLGVIFTMVSYYKQRPTLTQKEYITQVGKNTDCFRHFLRENKTLFASAAETGVPVILAQGSTQQEDLIEELEGLVSEILLLSNIE